MNSTKKFCLALLILLVAQTTFASEKFLLSNNLKSGVHKTDFPKDTKTIITDMTTSFVTEGEYASDAEAVETGKDGVLFDGNTGSYWKSRSYSKWGGGVWITVNIDLGGEYLVNEVNVWALHEATRDTDSFQLLFSKNGKDYTPNASVEMDEALEKKKDFFAKMSLELKKPVKARYMQVRIHRLKSAKQQQVGEIAIWGMKPEKGVSYLEAGTRPKVAFTVENIQSGVALIKWGDFVKLAEGVKGWKIYKSKTPFESVEQEGVSFVKSAKGSEKQSVVYPFTPGESFFFGCDRNLS
ncbi:MAG: discoidin domain-containing protein [Planctomycetes bacterium]|nr:discoidin domain-containing protein [Planctomycetota bacterium]